MKQLIAFLITFTVFLGVLAYLSDEPKQGVPPLLPQSPPSPQQSIGFEQAKNSISVVKLREAMEYLASPELKGRMPGQDGNDKAAEFVYNKFVQYGLKTSKQHFNIDKVNDPNNTSTGKTANIIGVIEGNAECIVIGAHLDHIGYGPSMSRAPNRREIHPGADDNASGTTALLEIARAFASLKGQNKRTIVFIGFSAEEMGLVGSEYYCKNPAYPLNQTMSMLNMDMISRYKSNGNVGCLGAGNSPQLRQIAESVKGNLKVNITNSSGGGSDQAPFAKRGVPTIFIHTGVHSDYHTPDDSATKVDYDGLNEITKFVFALCWNMDKQEGKPKLIYQYVPVPFKDHD